MRFLLGLAKASPAERFFPHRQSSATSGGCLETNPAVVLGNGPAVAFQKPPPA